MKNQEVLNRLPETEAASPRSSRSRLLSLGLFRVKLTCHIKHLILPTPGLLCLSLHCPMLPQLPRPYLFTCPYPGLQQSFHLQNLSDPSLTFPPMKFSLGRVRIKALLHSSQLAGEAALPVLLPLEHCCHLTTTCFPLLPAAASSVLTCSVRQMGCRVSHRPRLPAHANFAFIIFSLWNVLFYQLRKTISTAKSQSYHLFLPTLL